MILAAHEVSGEQLDTDIVIIGAGPAGASLCSGLRRDAIVIESGDFQQEPARSAEFAADPVDLPVDTLSMSARVIGGSGALWSGRCGEMDEIDFENKPWSAHTGWPISLAQLKPHFRQAWSALGLQPIEQMSPVIDRSHSSGLPPLHHMKMQLWQYCFSAPNTARHLGNWFFGTFLEKGKSLIRQADAVELIAEGRKVTAVKILDRNGRPVLIRARHVVLAGGCIENSRFLLDNTSNNPGLLDTVKPWLGRGFHQHLLIGTGVLTASSRTAELLQRHFNRFRRPPAESYEIGLKLAPDHIRQHQVLNASVTFRYAPSGLRSYLPLPRLAMARMIGLEPLFAFPTINAELSVEQEIDRDFAIRLGPRLNANGRPRAELRWGISELDLRTASRMVAVLQEWLQLNGLGSMASFEESREFVLSSMRDSLHHLGGTRMSDSPASGVVDADLRVHGAANLSVVGGSVFPTGGHVNPTLTIVALALRLAHHLNDHSDVPEVVGSVAPISRN